MQVQTPPKSKKPPIEPEQPKKNVIKIPQPLQPEIEFTSVNLSAEMSDLDRQIMML